MNFPDEVPFQCYCSKTTQSSVELIFFCRGQPGVATLGEPAGGGGAATRRQPSRDRLLREERAAARGAGAPEPAAHHKAAGVELRQHRTGNLRSRSGTKMSPIYFICKFGMAAPT